MQPVILSLHMVLLHMVRNIRNMQHLRKVELLRLPVFNGFSRIELVDTSNHFVDSPETQFCHPFADFLRAETPRSGLSTIFRGRSLTEWAREVVEIAHAGLRARKRLDGDGNDETIYMAPLDRAVASGLAPADELLAKWQGEWKGSFAPLFRDYAY
jgi:hypothetical protein